MYVEGVISIIGMGVTDVLHFDTRRLLIFNETNLASIVWNCFYKQEVLFLELLYNDFISFDRFSAKWTVKRCSVVRISIVCLDKIIVAFFVELMCNVAGELGDFVIKR